MTLTEDRPATSTVVNLALTPDQIQAIASASVAAAGPREPTPIIQTVNVSVTDGMLHAVATDRYRVARIIFPVTAPDMAGVSIPVALIVGYAKQIKASKTTGGTLLVIADAPDEGHEVQSLTFSNEVAGITVRGMAVRGNFPPVARLFPDTYSEGVPAISLNMKFAADADKLKHPALNAGDYTHGAMRLRFTETTNVNKPGPVTFDRPGIPVAEGSLEYMLQPNLILR